MCYYVSKDEIRIATLSHQEAYALRPTGALTNLGEQFGDHEKESLMRYCLGVCPATKRPFAQGPTQLRHGHLVPEPDLSASLGLRAWTEESF